MNSLGSTINKDKVGNLIVYLSERISPLYHTNLIKLLYFIDEYAVKDNGIPITWLNYNAWEKGPVAPEAYYMKNEGSDNIFSDYIQIKKQGNSFKILPVKSFSNDLFSRYELRIIDQVINDLGNKRSHELIRLTHAEGSPWDIVVRENNIKFDTSKTTNINIELSEIVRSDKSRYHNYTEARDMMFFQLSPDNRLSSCFK